MSFYFILQISNYILFIISLTLRVWEVSVNEKTRKIIPTDCNLGQLKRIVNCIEVSIHVHVYVYMHIQLV